MNPRAVIMAEGTYNGQTVYVYAVFKKCTCPCIDCANKNCWMCHAEH